MDYRILDIRYESYTTRLAGYTGLYHPIPTSPITLGITPVILFFTESKNSASIFQKFGYSSLPRAPKPSRGVPAPPPNPAD